MPKITIQVPDTADAVYEFDEAQLTVGRSEGNDIIINHDSMSGTHAQLVLNEDGTYTLADNGSTNGTFVNGEQIVERVLLDGVDILFGQVGAVYSHPEIAELGFDEMEESAADTGGGFANQPLETSGRPANFQSISPFPKKKVTSDPVATAATALGWLSIVCAAGLIAAVFLIL